jgi:hypothetical protein
MAAEIWPTFWWCDQLRELTPSVHGVIDGGAD